jgi:DtxR family transcriptional regulator, manganese transport regulator
MNLKRKYRHQSLGPDTGSTESREDYLACIFELIAKKGYARVMDIADSLSVTEPSASAMITRLAKNEYIKREKYRGFTLTKTGRAVAHRIHLRRRTLMIFLQSLGLPRKVITRDVHGLEHHLSKQTLNCLTRLVRANRKSGSHVKLTNHQAAPESQRPCSLPTGPKNCQQLVD